jgi:biopolymer transport protein ExbD
MKINLAQKEEAKFEMAPMIDMVFLLLVFFMMASQMAQQQNIKLKVPDASKSVVPKNRPDRWIVNITEKGDLFEGDKPILLEQLSDHLRAQLKLNPNTKVYLRADKNTKHKEVKKVMMEMAKVGVSDFIFATLQGKH